MRAFFNCTHKTNVVMLRTLNFLLKSKWNFRFQFKKIKKKQSKVLTFRLEWRKKSSNSNQKVKIVSIRQFYSTTQHQHQCFFISNWSSLIVNRKDQRLPSQQFKQKHKQQQKVHYIIYVCLVVWNDLLLIWMLMSIIIMLQHLCRFFSCDISSFGSMVITVYGTKSNSSSFHWQLLQQQKQSNKFDKTTHMMDKNNSNRSIASQITIYVQKKREKKLRKIFKDRKEKGVHKSYLYI